MTTSYHTGTPLHSQCDVPSVANARWVGCDRRKGNVDRNPLDPRSAERRTRRVCGAWCGALWRKGFVATQQATTQLEVPSFVLYYPASGTRLSNCDSPRAAAARSTAAARRSDTEITRWVHIGEGSQPHEKPYLKKVVNAVATHGSASLAALQVLTQARHSRWRPATRCPVASAMGLCLVVAVLLSTNAAPFCQLNE